MPPLHVSDMFAGLFGRHDLSAPRQAQRSPQFAFISSSDPSISLGVMPPCLPLPTCTSGTAVQTSIHWCFSRGEFKISNAFVSCEKNFNGMCLLVDYYCKRNGLRSKDGYSL